MAPAQNEFFERLSGETRIQIYNHLFPKHRDIPIRVDEHGKVKLVSDSIRRGAYKPPKRGSIPQLKLLKVCREMRTEFKPQMFGRSNIILFTSPDFAQTCRAIACWLKQIEQTRMKPQSLVVHFGHCYTGNLPSWERMFDLFDLFHPSTNLKLVVSLARVSDPWPQTYIYRLFPSSDFEIDFMQFSEATKQLEVVKRKYPNIKGAPEMKFLKQWIDDMPTHEAKHTAFEFR